MKDFFKLFETNPIYYYSLLTWCVFAIIIFFILIKFKNLPTYGRHVSKKGILINNRLGWVLMEIPTLILMPYFIFSSNNNPSIVIWCFFGLYMLHYINRTIIFPLRLKVKKNKIPIHIIFSAAVFNFCNTFFLGYYFGKLADYNLDWFKTPYFIFGILLFFTGFFINQQSDTILINLRKEEGREYKIPFGGLFKYISCPNHFGEIIEWLGFAILTCSFAGFSFSLWTACNLLPRSKKHHNWYKKEFEDYPKERKVALPFFW